MDCDTHVRDRTVFRQPVSTGENSSVLRFEDVSVTFGDVKALDGVSFEISAGETRVVLGAAGSGKTVLLSLHGRPLALTPEPDAIGRSFALPLSLPVNRMTGQNLRRPFHECTKISHLLIGLKEPCHVLIGMVMGRHCGEIFRQLAIVDQEMTVTDAGIQGKPINPETLSAFPHK